MGRLEEKLAELETMSPAQLRSAWTQAFGQASPASYGPDLLVLGLGYRLQDRGAGVGRRVERQLASLAAGTAAGEGSLPPGTRLAREWNGRTHHVQATESGFRYRDRDYRSLTAIAREITGAGWSGPRFFGLKADRRG